MRTTLRVVAIRAWHRETGAGPPVAVLFAIGMPVPGVGLEVRPTHPCPGDRHMEPVDPALQRALLQRLAEHYPRAVSHEALADLGEPHTVRSNAQYLEDHRLITVRWTTTGDPEIPFSYATILPAGIDFLADDGGLTAIRGTVTVKLHQDTLRALLIDRVQAEDADDGVKAKIVSQLKALPAEAISRLCEKALDAGLRAMPSALRWLQTTLSQS